LDRDSQTDLYEIVRGKVRLVTSDPKFGGICESSKCNFSFASAAAGGSVVFVGSSARLTSEDQDSSWDYFRIEGNQVSLVTGGPRAGGIDSKGAEAFDLVPGTSNEVYFQTTEPLVDEDTDSTVDIYRHTASGTELVSDWPSKAGESYGPIEIAFSKAVPGRLYLTARQFWFGTDPGDESVVYLVDPGQDPVLVGRGSLWNSSFGGESADGSTVYFTSDEALDPLDLDDDPDVYAWNDGSVSMVSVGNVASPPLDDEDPYGDNRVVHVSANGDVLFLSTDQISSQDTDDYADLYRRSGDSVEFLSHGSGRESSTERLPEIRVLDDGKRILMTTAESWLPTDKDDNNDLYELKDDRLTLLSGLRDGYDGNIGPLEGPVPLQALSGGKYLFTTNGALTNDDGDEGWDAYMFNPVRPTRPGLVSKGILTIYRGPDGHLGRKEGPVTFWFKQVGKRAKFMCRMDERRFRPCSSPVTFKNMKDGRHLFEVASIGRHGLGLRAAAGRKFYIGT
jgi:hypothetical protein